MATAQNAPRRTEVHDDGFGYRITIRAARSWPMVILLCVWLSFWVVSEAAILAGFATGATQIQGLAAALWLVGWTAGGIFLCFALLWSLVGREVIGIDREALVVGRELLGHGWSTRFETSEVRHLRYAPLVRPFGKSYPFGKENTTIAFEANGATYRFGDDLSEEEARRLIATIRQLIPALTDPPPKLGSAAPEHHATAASERGEFHRLSVEEDEIDGFRIVIRGGRRVGEFGQLVGVLCVWTVIEAALLALVCGIVLAPAGARMAAGAETYLLLALIGLLPWTYVGATMIAALLWHLSGPEVILVDDENLVVRRVGARYHPLRAFGLAEIRDLRYSPPGDRAPATDLWTAQLRAYGVDGGAIAFEHGGETHRFGVGLSEAEALGVIRALTARAKIDRGSDLPPLPVSA